MGTTLARRLALVWLAAIGIFLGAIAPMAAAEDTALTAYSQYADGELTVTGQLTAGGEPVKNASIAILIDDTPVAAERTNDNGGYEARFFVPSELATGQHSMEVRFEGRGQLTANTVRIALDFGQGAQPEPPVPPGETTDPGQPTEASGSTQEPAAPVEPAEDKVATTLAAQLDDTEPDPGSLLAIDGTLVSGGEPLSGGEIHVTLGGTEQNDSLAYSTADGSFSTFLEVPSDQAPGATEVRISFPGTGSYLASDAVVTITVAAPEPEPTAEPSASPQPTEASAEATATATATVQDEDSEAETTPAAERSPWSWLWVGLVVVGGSALLVTIALLIRRGAGGRFRRDADADSEPLYLLGDEDDDNYIPEEHGWEEFEVDDAGTRAWSFDDVGEPTAPMPATNPPATEAEPTLPIYRNGPAETVERPNPRRSWSGED